MRSRNKRTRRAGAQPHRQPQPQPKTQSKPQPQPQASRYLNTAEVKGITKWLYSVREDGSTESPGPPPADIEYNFPEVHGPVKEHTDVVKDHGEVKPPGASENKVRYGAQRYRRAEMSKTLPHRRNQRSTRAIEKQTDSGSTLLVLSEVEELNRHSTVSLFDLATTSRLRNERMGKKPEFPCKD